MNNGSYKRYEFKGIKGQKYAFADICGRPLSAYLDFALEDACSVLFLCGTLEQMTQDYVVEPLSTEWKFARKYIHKFRSPVFTNGTHTVSVKLVGESWLPGCTDATEAAASFAALEYEWKTVTGLPLLSTPSKTGQMLMHGKFPKGAIYPKLDDDLALHIRNVSPQHRLEKFEGTRARHSANGILHKYDGRWMYAALCYLDRLPIGEPRKTREFKPFVPGWFKVNFRIPRTWEHIGLIPMKWMTNGNFTWIYPSEGDFVGSEVWVSEPELTLAMANGWEIEVIEGYQFAKGRPLAEWQKTLVDLRARLRLMDDCAAKAIREILNHAIGSLHRNDYEREIEVDAAQWKALDKSTVVGWQTIDDEAQTKLVVVRVPHQDKISIYMPHWSAQIYALERAKIAENALRCKWDTIAEIRGDAIYTTAYAPFADNGNLGQVRYQGMEVME